MPDPWDFSNQRPEAAEGTQGAPILTRAAALLCVALTLAWNTADLARGTWWEAIGRYGFLSKQDIWNGHYAALFTTVFLHGNPGSLMLTLMHIGFNLMILMQFGAALEATLSPLAWLAFFFGSAVVSSGAELAIGGQTGVGASGVVYAMAGLLWSGRRRFPLWQQVATPRLMNSMIVWGLFCFAGTLAGQMQIANYAHGAGFLFGLAVGWLFCSRRRTVLSGSILAGLSALTVMSVAWLPWSPDWDLWEGDRLRHRGQFEQAIDWYQRSLNRGLDPNVAWERIRVTEEQRGNMAGVQEAERQQDRASAAAPPQEQKPGRLDKLFNEP